MGNWYDLRGKTPVLLSFEQHIEYLKAGKGCFWKKVADSYIHDIHISTVYLGLNHRYDAGPPLLYETMIFGGPLDQEQFRYTSWQEAEQGHQEAVDRVRGALKWWYPLIARPRAFFLNLKFMIISLYRLLNSLFKLARIYLKSRGR